MANTHTIRQYDELPSWEFYLSFDNATAADQEAAVAGATTPPWPALNADDVVTIIARKGADAPILHKVPDAAIVRATRKVRWDFLSSQTAVAGEGNSAYKVWSRVTQANGKSYTHPLEGSDTLNITAAGASTDIADPA